MPESRAQQEVYRVRRPEVVSEVFEGEAVVVDLLQGRYYAFSPLASELWTRLEASPSLDELAGAAAERFGGEAAARDGLRPFLDSLVAIGLLVVDRRPSDHAPLLAPIGSGDDRRLDYETFTDLEELLVLDPIHELDESGWPLPPESRASRT